MDKKTSTGLLIKQLHDRLEKHANNALRKDDLTMMQVAVLMTLQEQPERRMSMKEIESRFSIAQSTAAGIVSRLEQKSLVKAETDNSDRRVKLVNITPDGESCCKKAACHMEDAEERLLRGFSEKEKEMLQELLTRAVNNIGD